MKNNLLKKTYQLASLIFVTGYLSAGLAHTAGGVIDPAGNNASATDLATVSCYDDGSGTPAYLYGQIQDLSSPVPGLLLSFHAFKGNQMLSTTDPVSGDSNASQNFQLYGGSGIYYISATKTAAGSRLLTVNYHCMTADNLHTGTDITLLQAQ